MPSHWNDPTLPQWLRDALRAAAGISAEEEEAKASTQVSGTPAQGLAQILAPPPVAPTAPGPAAGLQTQLQAGGAFVPPTPATLPFGEITAAIGALASPPPGGAPLFGAGPIPGISGPAVQAPLPPAPAPPPQTGGAPLFGAGPIPGVSGPSIQAPLPPTSVPGGMVTQAAPPGSRYQGPTGEVAPGTFIVTDRSDVALIARVVPGANVFFANPITGELQADSGIAAYIPALNQYLAGVELPDSVIEVLIRAGLLDEGGAVTTVGENLGGGGGGVRTIVSRTPFLSGSPGRFRGTRGASVGLVNWRI